MPDSLPSATEVQSDRGQKRVLHLGEALGRKGTKKRWEGKVQSKIKQADLEEVREGLHVVYTAHPPMKISLLSRREHGLGDSSLPS